jgi:hypothetical protein
MATSMAFRAWNRGLAGAGLPTFNSGGTVAFGVWLYNGTNWFPDPSFPGSGVCPGSTVLWAGKLDYWLIGSTGGRLSGSNIGPTQTLCRFDGVNLVWEPLSLPQATLDRLPVYTGTTTPYGGITAGACYAWNNCWFFGTDGIKVHWDGQALSDASTGPGVTPWLQGDFTAAVTRTDPAGNDFGLAVNTGSSSLPNQTPPVPAQPDGSPPPQVFGSRGGPFAPLGFFPPPAVPRGQPSTTDLVAIDSDPHGDAWVAGYPATWEGHRVGPAPLLRITPDGVPASCAGYDATTFTYDPSSTEYGWTSLSVFPNDGSALAGLRYVGTSVVAPPFTNDIEPGLVAAVCGQAPVRTFFRIPDPRSANPSTAPVVPGDYAGSTTALAALAFNDAWAATSDGALLVNGQGAPTKPHLYLWTDGQAPNAPAGDDNESRPSLFTIDPPVYVVQSPTIIVLPPTKHTHKKRRRRRTIRLAPPIYRVQAKVAPAGGSAFTLYITFRVRRPVTIGLQALIGNRVVASSGMSFFRGGTGQLVITLYRQSWPTRLRFVTPESRPRRSHR